MNWDEINAFHSGIATLAHDFLGAHPLENGFVFRVWAPNAGDVYVIGEFNDWEIGANKLERVSEGGIWEGEVSHAKEGDCYKYALRHKDSIEVFTKADPFARRMENPPNTASVLYKSNHQYSVIKVFLFRNFFRS